jgi:hypothetical protein
MKKKKTIVAIGMFIIFVGFGILVFQAENVTQAIAYFVLGLMALFSACVLYFSEE